MLRGAEKRVNKLFSYLFYFDDSLFILEKKVTPHQHIEWTPQGSSDHIRRDHWRLAIDTLLIPSLAMFGDRQNAYTEKPRKSRIELDAEFRLKSLDYK